MCQHRGVATAASIKADKNALNIEKHLNEKAGKESVLQATEAKRAANGGC
jgi:hypothetical protein